MVVQNLPEIKLIGLSNGKMRKRGGILHAQWVTKIMTPAFIGNRLHERRRDEKWPTSPDDVKLKLCWIHNW